MEGARPRHIHQPGFAGLPRGRHRHGARGRPTRGTIRLRYTEQAVAEDSSWCCREVFSRQRWRRSYRQYRHPCATSTSASRGARAVPDRCRATPRTVHQLVGPTRPWFERFREIQESETNYGVRREAPAARSCTQNLPLESRSLSSTSSAALSGKPDKRRWVQWPLNTSKYRYCPVKSFWRAVGIPTFSR
jgi:hypothetical protein